MTVSTLNPVIVSAQSGSDSSDSNFAPLSVTESIRIATELAASRPDSGLSAEQTRSSSGAQITNQIKIEKQKLAQRRASLAPAFIPSNPHYALLLSDDSCELKSSFGVQRFIRNDAKDYPNLDIQYVGGEPRLQIYRSIEARKANIISSDEMSTEELMALLQSGPQEVELPVAEIDIKNLDDEDIAKHLEFYNVKKGQAETKTETAATATAATETKTEL